MKKKWKWIAGAVLALAVLGTAVAQGFQSLKLELLKIDRRNIAQTFTEEGEVVTDSEYPVSTVSGGKVVRRPVKEGQTVKKGALLIEFDSAELVFQAKELQAQLKSVGGEEDKTLNEPYPTEMAKQEAVLAQAKRSKEAAKNNFERINTLYQSGAASRVEYENARNALSDAESKVTIETSALEAIKTQHNKNGGTGRYYAGLKESLKAQLDNIRYQMAQCTIEAPSDGTIAQISVKEGETVPPNSTVMNLLQKSLFKVEVFVLTEDVDDIKIGDRVILIQDKLDKDITFPGIVSGIAPSAVKKTSALGLEEQRVKVSILPEVPENITLRPGYALDVKFKTAEENDRLVVPKTAVFPYNGRDAVWVVRQGKADIQPITTGFENDTEAAVTRGLQKGDLIVLDPQAEGLKEGKRVKQQ